MYMYTTDRKMSYLGLIVASLFLLASSAAGQQSKQQLCLKLKEKIYSADAVRQGDFYDVALRFESRGCLLGLTTQFTPVQATWHAEPDGGLQADEQSFVGRPLPGDEVHTAAITLTIRVTAGSEVEAGKRMIRGVLNYEAIEASGARAEQLSVELPVKVVSAGAPVHARKIQADDTLKWYQIVILIVTFPIAFLIYAANEC